MTELEIDAFLAIVKTGSITAAAQRLYVTQPALSRRIYALEQELGCKLLIRNKGIRSIELTNEGKAFIPIAEKWKDLWAQTKDINKSLQDNAFKISSIGSVSSYILPSVFREFLHNNSDCQLVFHHYSSQEAYNYVSKGEIDLAFISDDVFSKDVETVPAFKEKMVLITSCGEHTDFVHPSSLNPEYEIRLPWYPEYDMWHNYWFGPNIKPRVFLDQMSLMEYFLEEKQAWVIAPISAALELKKNSNLKVHSIIDGPPDRIIYYLVKKGSSIENIDNFLSILKKEIKNISDIVVYI